MKAKRPPGRPPLSPQGSVTYNIRLTPEQRTKLEMLGGAEWIRAMLDTLPRVEEALVLRSK